MKFIAWGVKLHTHTHSYIHVAFCKAFKYLGYDVYHFDEYDDVSNFDFSNSIFLTADICDNKIPLIKNAKYILHNCDTSKYQGLNYLMIQVYTTAVQEGSEGYKEQDMEKVDNFVFYSKKNNILYQPWATDLLPHEIDTEYHHVANKKCIWIGTIGHGGVNDPGIFGNTSELIPFVESCNKYGYEWVNLYPGSCSFEQNKELISTAEIAPAINGEWQKIKHYIPCRIFKNISYGKIGITNNPAVNELLEGNVVYGPSNELMDEYIDLNYSDKLNTLFSNSCKLVKDKHTYLNRIDSILRFL